MKKICLTISLLLLLSGFTPVSAKPAAIADEPMLVTAEWLAKHIDDKNLVLLHVGDKKEYDAGHIPGAQFIQRSDFSTPPGEGRLILQLPPVEQLKASFEKFGVSDNSRIVIYFSNKQITPAARVYFTLDYLGLGGKTSMLDGGIDEWKKLGKPLTAEVKTPAPGKFTPRPNASLVVESAWLKENLNQPKIAVIDSRTANFYSGKDNAGMPRAGHLPGAKNLPFPTLMISDTDMKLKDLTALKKMYQEAGADKDKTVVTYCHIGQQASLGYFVAKMLGYNAKLYDGSFDEWSRNESWPIEVVK
ncbi:MAG: sulfurtransferase [Blastocatellia bacterium]